METIVIGKPSINIYMPLESFPEEGDIFYIDNKTETVGGISATAACLLGKWGMSVHYTGVVGDDGFAEKLIESGINHFICMPKTGFDIGKELPEDKTYFAEDLKTAVDIAKKVTAKGKICILSPAAASYEYFKNYAEKADKYKEYIFNE